MLDREGGVELATITITKTLYDDDVIIDIDHTDGLAIVDAVGMLAFAQHTMLDVHGLEDDE
jgi:hypothetical protein